MFKGVWSAETLTRCGAGVVSDAALPDLPGAGKRGHIAAEPPPGRREVMYCGCGLCHVRVPLTGWIHPVSGKSSG